MAVEGIYTEKEKCENVYFNLVDNGEFVTLELVDVNGNHVMCGDICHIDKNQVGLINAVMLTVNLGLLLILMVV